MKFAIFALAVGGLVSAQELVQRDLATIQSAVTAVGDSLKKLDDAVKAFKASDTNSVSNLASAASSVTQTLADSTKKVQGTSNITLNDAVTLQSQVSGLQNAGTALVNDVVNIKPEVQKAGLCDVVNGQLTGISGAAKNLISAVVTKLPDAVQSIGAQQAAGLTNALGTLQSVYGSGNCTNMATGTGGGGGSGGPGSNGTGTGGTKGTPTSRPATFTGAAATAGAAAAPVGALLALAAAML